MPRSALALAAVTALLLVSSTVSAQRLRYPSPESEKLETKDGVKLHITYYPSNVGREATPVVLLHDLKESAEVYRRLARRLQQPEQDDKHKSFAVVTVDFRGHGDSMKQTLGSKTRELDAAKLSVKDLQAIVYRDMEAVRKFLVEENDAGKLNLNRLSVIGAGLGAVVATNWAAVDWATPPLATVKQGQDVKALVLISPRWKMRGLDLRNALRQPGVQREVAVMLLYGAGDRRNKADAERIYGQLERYHPDARGAKLSDLPDLVRFAPDTKLQGSQWLKQAKRRGEDLIISFLTKHVADQSFEYSVRLKE